MAVGGTVISSFPAWAKLAGVALAVWAGWATASNRCIKLKVGLTLNGASPGFYKGGYCK
jgi:hypothetical protein